MWTLSSYHIATSDIGQRLRKSKLAAVSVILMSGVQSGSITKIIGRIKPQVWLSAPHNPSLVAWQYQRQRAHRSFRFDHQLVTRNFPLGHRLSACKLQAHDQDYSRFGSSIIQLLLKIGDTYIYQTVSFRSCLAMKKNFSSPFKSI